MWLLSSLYSFFLTYLQRVFFRACNFVFYSSGFECSSAWFDCGNGKCISEIWLCDGDNDCGNLKDEHECGKCCSNKYFICIEFYLCSTIVQTGDQYRQAHAKKIFRLLIKNIYCLKNLKFYLESVYFHFQTECVTHVHAQTME